MPKTGDGQGRADLSLDEVEGAGTSAAHRNGGSCESKPWPSTNTAMHHRPQHGADCECAGRPSPDNVWSGTNPIARTMNYGNGI
jgi:hypothetical protein